MKNLIIGKRNLYISNLKWIHVIGLLFGLVLVTSACSRSSFQEVESMQPWPNANHQPASIVPLNLNSLGLGDAIVMDARSSESLWSEGIYEDGAVAEYKLDGDTAVWLAALRYDESEAAGEEYMGMVSWAEANCGRYGWLRLGGIGLIECGLSDGYNKTFMNDIWIVDVIVQVVVPEPPDEFVNAVRDAIVQHWETLD